VSYFENMQKNSKKTIPRKILVKRKKPHLSSSSVLPIPKKIQETKQKRKKSCIRCRTLGKITYCRNTEKGCPNYLNTNVNYNAISKSIYEYRPVSVSSTILHIPLPPNYKPEDDIKTLTAPLDLVSSNSNYLSNKPSTSLDPNNQDAELLLNFYNNTGPFPLGVMMLENVIQYKLDMIREQFENVPNEYVDILKRIIINLYSIPNVSLNINMIDL